MNKQKIDFEKLLKIKKPLSEEEIIKKNELKKQINSLSKDYELAILNLSVLPKIL